MLRFFVIITEKLGERRLKRNGDASVFLATASALHNPKFCRSRNSSAWITFAPVVAAPRCAGPEKFSTFRNLNRQTHEFKNAVSYRKQTTATCSNRQNIQKTKYMFSAAFFSPARIPKRTTNAPTENEL